MTVDGSDDGTDEIEFSFVEFRFFDFDFTKNKSIGTGVGFNWLISGFWFGFDIFFLVPDLSKGSNLDVPTLNKQFTAFKMTSKMIYDSHSMTHNL